MAGTPTTVAPGSVRARTSPRRPASRASPFRIIGTMMADPTRQDIAHRGGRAVAQVLGRTAFVRVVTLVGTVVLARLLSPAEFGAYAIVGAIVGAVSLVGDLGLGASLIQQPEPPDATERSTARTLQVVMAVVAVAVLWAAAPVLVSVFGDLGPDGVAYLRVLSLILLPGALRIVPGVMLERDLQYQILAIAEVGAHLVFYGVAIALAVTGASTWSFVVASVTQVVVGSLIVNLAWARRRRALPEAAPERGRTPARGRAAGWLAFDPRVLRRRGGFAVGFQTANVLAWLRDAVVPLAGGVLGGAVVVGHLQFAWRTSQLVSSVEDVVARVAFPAFSRLQHDRTGLVLAVAGATTASAYLIVPAQLWVAAVAPTLVPWLFGPQWDAAIVPLQLACLAAVTRFPVRMVRQGEFAGGRIRRGVQIVAIGCALTWVLVPPGLVWGGEIGAAVGLLISGALALGAMAALPTLGRVPFRDLTRIVVESALAAGAGALVLALAPWSTTLDLAASGAATLAVLAALFLLLERAPLERLRRILLSSEAPGPAVV